jgi:hypothetical protein
LSWSRARPQKVPLVNSACADGRERGGGGGAGGGAQESVMEAQQESRD